MHKRVTSILLEHRHSYYVIPTVLFQPVYTLINAKLMKTATTQ